MDSSSQHRKETDANSNASRFLKTDGGKTKTNAIEVPSISLPKGGGAIKGIDEKFSVNSVNGTASFSIPLPEAGGRGIAPGLSLSYNSGSGNGIFGLGWTLSLSSIKRKTEKSLPEYIDSIDSDTFLFSEAEDLVPEFQRAEDGTFAVDTNGEYIIKEKSSLDNLFTIRFYRPRVEGLFARIERWTANTGDEIKWRVITKENITTLFGWSSAARISDPDNPAKIYTWLPEFICDDKGNCCRYFYKPDSIHGFDEDQIHNRNRVKNGDLTYTNLYPDKICYGNKTPYKNFGDAFPASTEFLFETVFDYGTLNEGDEVDQINNWDFRPDAFSDYKPGFEIRTTRLCKRVLLFHRFEENEYNGLVRSLNFGYDTATEQDFTYLKSITSSGHIKQTNGSYSSQSLPPFEFEYQKHDWNTEVKTISPDSLVHAPVGLDESSYQFTDLYNEGLAGILSEQMGGWYYKHNLGNGDFEKAKLVSEKPSFVGLGSQLQLVDLDADGGKQLVSLNSEPKGFFELGDDNEWQPYRNFKQLPNINFSDPFTRMIDLNGDGMADLLIGEENNFTWFESKGRSGYKEARKSAQSFDEEAGPHLVFVEAKQSIFLADMSGDGLTDIVRIRNGEVCYWPNLGYGKFGKKVSMDQAPFFDSEEMYNPGLVKLADIDGSGTPDIIYLGHDTFKCWKNLSGDRFSAIPFEIPAFPEVNATTKVSVTDLLGNGVSCIVWSSPLPGDIASPLKYIDLMNSKKPHIMTSYKNNMGKEVSMEYMASTKFYIEDKLAGKPWITKLHFPVHCVSKTVNKDKITGHQFTTEYKYHHGYFDHPEKEFRGFGMVEQIDSETFEHWIKSGATNITAEDLHQQPVISRQWVHTGAFLQKDKILTQFEHEYWYEEMQRQGLAVTHSEHPLPDAILVASEGIPGSIIENLSPDEWHQALRACKGMGLRTETFARDAAGNGNTPEARRKELTPFSVATHNCVIELLQPKGKNKHAVFVVKESEAITYSYERVADDPRIAHSLNIKLDAYGQVLESASVVYPRVNGDNTLPVETQAAQDRVCISYTKNRFTADTLNDDVTHPDLLRLPALCEVQIFELKGINKAGSFYSLSDFEDILSNTNSDTALYHERDKALTAGKAQKRLIEHTRTIFYNDNLLDPLALGQLHSLALPFENYQLAYTPELLEHIYTGRVTDDLMVEGKFAHNEGDSNWWIRSGSTQYITAAETAADAENRFFVPISFTEPFGGKTSVKYDNTYHLFIAETEDALGNKSVLETYNYRTLSVRRMRDINANISEVITDELGMVKATAIFGKGSQADDLTGLNETTSAAELDLIHNFFNPPVNAQGVSDSSAMNATGAQLLQNATTRFLYDFNVYQSSGKPAVIGSILRETHTVDKNGDPNPSSKLQMSFEYSSGDGQVVMKKTQAEPGLAKRVRIMPDDAIEINDIDTTPFLRWIGTGKTILNNKGNPVKRYEPYFSVNILYEDQKELVETGMTPLMYYDALGRLVRTDMPDGSFSTVEFDSWKQVLSDANDNVLDSDWYKRRTDNSLSDFISDMKEQQAAARTALHARTPNQLHFDTLGRPVLAIEHNKNIATNADEFYNTKTDLDIEGNMLSVTDARGNKVMQHHFDMLGNKVYQLGMDTGQRWLLANILGNPLRTWDERGHEFLYEYDVLHRPVQSTVRGGDGLTPLNHIFERFIYGEGLLIGVRTEINRFNEAALQATNILGKVINHFDTGGVIETPAYDFKGHAVSTTRRLFRKYKEVANWTDANLVPDLEPDAITFSVEMDALNRITKQIAPDSSILTPVYNEAGLLNSESVEHLNPGLTKTYIKEIDYNEKGQRSRILYDNEVVTKYEYDKETLRLKHLKSSRKDNSMLQDLHYTFDPAGNITHIEDKSIPTRFFNNFQVQPASTYTYDALYRLVEATGRENDTAINFGQCDNWNDRFFVQSLNPGDPMAIRNYTQKYQYDEVGNIKEMKHLAANANWTRTYEYENTNNRLVNTHIGDNGSPQNYTNYSHHPQHGFLTELPHLEEIAWNFKEEVVLTSRQRCTDDNIPITTYYQYDGTGQRIRKVTENFSATNNPTKKEERIYVSGYEIFKKHTGTAAGLERISLSLMDKGHRFVMIETRNDVDDGTDKHVIRYSLHNHVGSSALELDLVADVISYEEYHPYGTTAYQAKSSAIRAAAKRYRYTGMERDDETGLEYHSARYYLPWLGRWLNPDPIGLGDGLNLYCYARSNPVRLNDTNGHLSWGQVIGIAAAVVVGTVLTVATAGLAGPLVGAAGAAIIGGIVGGAAGGAVGELVEARIDNREAHVGRAALIGGIAGGLFAGAGAAAGAVARTAVGRAFVSRVATSAVGQAASGVARRVAQSVAGRGASRAVAAIREPAERLGQRIAQRLGVGPGAQAVERAIATERSVEAVAGVTRTTTTAAEGQTFTHSTAASPTGGNVLNQVIPNSSGAQIEAQGALRVSPGGQTGQWGEGAYAWHGEVTPTSGAQTFQFRVPPQTAVQTVNIPGRPSIVRLVPPPGESVVPIQITGSNFPPGSLQTAGEQLQQFGMPLPGRLPFRYPGVSPDVSGVTGALGGSTSLFFMPAPPTTDPRTVPTPSVGVQF